MSLKSDLTDLALGLDDVELKPSRFGSSGKPAFYVGRREFCHFHGGNEIDVRLTRKVIRALREDLDADKRVTRRGSSDWLEFRFRRRTDLPRALELLELARDANR